MASDPIDSGHAQEGSPFEQLLQRRYAYSDREFEVLTRPEWSKLTPLMQLEALEVAERHGRAWADEWLEAEYLNAPDFKAKWFKARLFWGPRSTHGYRSHWRRAEGDALGRDPRVTAFLHGWRYRHAQHRAGRA